MSNDHGLPSAQDVVEAALACGDATPGRSDDDATICIVEEEIGAEVRFANNTTTTNGRRRDRRVTVIAIKNGQQGVASGVARQGGNVEVTALVKAAQDDAADASAAPDAFALIAPGQNGGSAFASAPGTTDLSVLGGVLADLHGAFQRADANSRVLAGFAEHKVETTYLGSSTGLRLRHQQPTGALHLVARSLDGRRSVWTGAGTKDFSDVSIARMDDHLAQRLEWAAHRIEVPAGRQPVVLPPEAVADLMTSLAFDADGRSAEDGSSVFSAAGGRTRVGEVISTTPFHLLSDPMAPGLECAPFLVTSRSGSDRLGLRQRHAS